MALLFFSSQVGQLLGALVPAHFSNAFSSGLMYLLLLAVTLLMYWRAKALRSKGEPADDTADQWAERFGFSPREVEIVALLMKRTPYRQIGEQLFVSDNTVKTHVRNIYKKADVSSREELLEKLSDVAKKG